MKKKIELFFFKLNLDLENNNIFKKKIIFVDILKFEKKIYIL
jgi:hypothetical protein